MIESLTQFLMQILGPIVDLIAHHPLATLICGVLWWLLSGVSSSLPEPLPTDGRGYIFIYKFGHWFSGSLGRIYERLRFGRSAQPPGGTDGAAK